MLVPIFNHLLGRAGVSGFGSGTTAHEVGDELADNIKGRTCLITGVGAKGLGLEATRVVLLKGANVIVCARNPDAARACVAEAVGPKTNLDGRLHSVPLDLASLDSVSACAKAVEKLKLPLDTIILNAGIMMCPLGRTKEGFEMQFGVNVAGHFALCNLLMPMLAKTCKPSNGPKGRIVCVSSLAHLSIPGMNFDDLNYEKRKYNAQVAYGESKLGNALHARELQRRIDANGLGDRIIAVSLHPGVIPGSNLSRHVLPGFLASFIESLPDFVTNTSAAAGNFVFKTVKQGAATHIYTGFSDHDQLRPFGGDYFDDCNRGKIVSKALRDRAQAQRLWLALVELTKTDWGSS